MRRRDAARYVSAVDLVWADSFVAPAPLPEVPPHDFFRSNV